MPSPLAKRLLDIYRSLRAMPLWVQIWMVFILVPANLAPLAFWSEPQGPLIASLALLGMLFNVPLLWLDRGFSRRMALPHLPFWSALVILLIFARPDGSPAYQNLLSALLVINAISLIFDYRDAWLWWRDRG